MSEQPTPTPDAQPATDYRTRAVEIFGKLRATDQTIKRLTKQIEAHKRRIVDIENLCSVARVGIRARERGLFKESIVVLRKETGIRALPGFGSAQEEADDYRKTQRKLAALTEAAERGLSQ
jgi:hypothetical protein